MKFVGFMCLTLLSVPALAENALRDDGREVRLNNDGTWQYVSTDVYATSESGLRVKLNPNGSWLPAAPMNPVNKTAGGSEPVSSFNDLVSLDTIEIQKVKQQRSMGAKSAVYTERTLILLHFMKAPVPSGANGFSLRDSNDNVYPVILVEPVSGERLLIQAEGAPDRWSRAKSMTLTIEKSLLGSLADIELSSDFRDIDTQIVSEFGLN